MAVVGYTDGPYWQNLVMGSIATEGERAWDSSLA